MAASIYNSDHLALQGEVIKWLKESGFLVESLTYHEKLSKLMVDRLSSCDTFTSLAIRGGADLIAVHPQHDLCVKLEFKTVRAQKGRSNNIVIEALPLAYYLQSPGDCLYVCRYLSSEGLILIDGAFWANQNSLPPIDNLVIPPRWANTRPELQRRVANYLRLTFPGVGEVYEASELNGGSNDPFIKISPRVFAATTQPWKKVLTRWWNTEGVRTAQLKQLMTPPTPIASPVLSAPSMPHVSEF